jgi:tRNA G18 (ribose-2'-O)-methylase SpoU
MRQDNLFTQRKFLSLPPERQHRHAAKLLRAIYENTLPASASSYYEQLAQWAGWEEIQLLETALEKISDRYHWHMQRANCFVKEPQFLSSTRMGISSIRKGDRDSGETPLQTSIFLDKIRSAHNIGSIVRTTEAFRLGSLYFSEGMAYIDHKQVKDTAMGTQEWVSCQKNRALETLPKPVILLETSSHSQSIFDFIFPNQFTLVIGNEEYGCSEKSLQLADALVEIPLAGRKNSLNVANAFAIAAGEIHRQRRLNPLNYNKGIHS